jgi:uncharacterized membrane protein YkoI
MTYSMAPPYAKRELRQNVKLMVSRLFLLLAAFGTVAIAPAADARPRDREQDVVFKAMKQGRIMPLRQIEARVLPRMRGAEYLGPELDPGSGTYRLKFMHGGRVIWIDVDARTGEVIGKSGH